MRILIFNWRDTKHTWAGGGELYIFEQASRWAKHGHHVSLFCSQDIRNNLPSFEVIEGINVYRRGGRFTVYLWAMWYYFRHFRTATDVVVDVENGIPFFTPLFCRVPKVCYVYHVHGEQFFYELPMPISAIGYFIERFVFPLLYRRLPIVAISKTTKKQLVKLGIPKANISIVYCGMNGTSMQSVKPDRKFAHPTILYLGRIKKYKRVDTLVTLFNTIIKRIPHARLIIAGWGTEASQLTDMIMQNPLRRKISLLGPVSSQEKRLILSKSWVFVNPSAGEGWSIAVIEANLYGTPAVAFDVPGLAESIRHGVTGLLARSDRDLIDNVCNVLTNRRLRERLSVSAAAWARSFSWDRSAEESLRILTKQLQR